MATLLLADDSLTTQKVVSLTFADEGIEVITAGDGDTALKLFHERRPDIVLADVNIPGLNGYEVCEEIRKTSDINETPVVLLVGSFEPFDAHEAHRVGANDYLTKPFASIRRLVATVLAFLDERPAVAEATSSIDEVEEITVEPTISEREGEDYQEAEAQPETTDEPESTEQAFAEAQISESTLSEPVMEMSTAELPEPDMFATNDIENLYSQSFAETVEMPHTVAERMQYNDVSADDELIETTTYTEPQQTPPENQEAAPSQEIERLEAGPESDSERPFHENIAAETMDETAAATAPGEQAESADFASLPDKDTEPAAPAPEASESPVEAQPDQEGRPQDAPTEEYNFDFRSGETLFEPAPESLTSPVETTTEHVPETFSSAEPSVETVAQTEQVESQADEEFRPAGPTPWDTVAAPSESGITFDESNLLELPTETPTHRLNDESTADTGVSTEMVERIARIVASQISEHLIREISERIVPMVVEETLARRRGEIDH
ncbi:MAG TPA: response regulator [Pyrinomonadaceae bacterium]|nr:response regulator [Pyrinomonadaceae bacterium]